MNDDLLLVVLTDVPDDRADEWNDWYDRVHLPNMQQVAQVQWAARYDVVDDPWSLDVPFRYASVQGFASHEAFDSYRSSDDFRRMREEYMERYADSTTLGRLVLHKRPYWRGREDAR